MRSDESHSANLSPKPHKRLMFSTIYEEEREGEKEKREKEKERKRRYEYS